MSQYDDPADIKKHVLKPKFNDPAFAAIVAIARLNHMRPTTLVHDVMLKFISDHEQQLSENARVA